MTSHHLRVAYPRMRGKGESATLEAMFSDHCMTLIPVTGVAHWSRMNAFWQKWGWGRKDGVYKRTKPNGCGVDMGRQRAERRGGGCHRVTWLRLGGRDWGDRLAYCSWL